MKPPSWGPAEHASCSTLATASGRAEQSHGAPRLCGEGLVPSLRLAPLLCEYFGERLVLLLLGVEHLRRAPGTCTSVVSCVAWWRWVCGCAGVRVCGCAGVKR